MKKRNILILLAINIAVLAGVQLMHKQEEPNLMLEELRAKYTLKKSPSIDHSKLPALQKVFNSPQEVTETCISCHTERHIEVMESSHWNWERLAYVEDKGVTALGKKNAFNNFCIGAQSNEQSCAKCHIGFGMDDNQFDFTNARNVDCMVCHDNSEAYMKGAALAGYPDRSVNLTQVAQSVGSPLKSNCGSCHFYGGGGNNVKHGDIEEATLTATRDIDVHMAVNGLDMQCVDCHTAENHQMLGRLYSVSSENTQRSTCEQCHSGTPHLKEMLNRHTAKVACQTCHIPEYAKVNATKMAWKWSEAGKLEDHKPYHTEDSLGNHTYLSEKGEFTWARNVEPEYLWFNGHAKHYTHGDTIDISNLPLKINQLLGSHDDNHSKIYPVKVHVGDQIYDKKYKYLIQPKLYGEQKGDSAFWMDFDWNLAAAAGMKRVGLPYSGTYDFIETEMFLPLNHMVSPKDNSLSCSECHQRDNGRLAALTGFYMPGRDYDPWIDRIGFLLVVITTLGVIIHGVIRIYMNIKANRITTLNIDK